MTCIMLNKTVKIASVVKKKEEQIPSSRQRQWWCATVQGYPTKYQSSSLNTPPFNKK